MHASLPTDQYQDCLQYDQLVDNTYLTTHNNKHLTINFPTSPEGAYEYKNEFEFENDTVSTRSKASQKNNQIDAYSSARNAQDNKIVSNTVFTSNNGSLQYSTAYIKENVWPI